MRTRFAPFAAALLVLSARPAAAQLAAVSPVSFSVFAGADIPRGTFADGYNTGYIVGGAADLHIPLAPIGFRGEFTYAGLGGKNFQGATLGTLTDLGVNLDAVFGVFNLLVASPYLIAGGSYSRLGASGSYLGTTSSTTENHYGFNAGVGVDLPLGVMAARVDVRYKQINVGNGESFKSIPITFGIRF